jgi:hypothetical protein
MNKKRFHTWVDWADWALLRVYIDRDLFPDPQNEITIFGIHIGPVCFELAWGDGLELEEQYPEWV